MMPMQDERRIAVHKFQFPIQSEAIVVTPRQWHPLHVEASPVPGYLTVWAEIDVDEIESFDRKIRVYGTGHVQEIGTCHSFIGTVVQADLDLVWHVYEEHEHDVHATPQIAAISIGDILSGLAGLQPEEEDV